MNMARRKFRVAVPIAAAVMLLAAQILALAHASAYGGDLHHHETGLCQVQMLTAQGAGIAAEPPLAMVVPFRSAPPDIWAENLVRGLASANPKTIRGPPPPSA